MSTRITIDLQCPKLDCSARFVETLPREEAMYEAVAAAKYECPQCGVAYLRRVPSAPNLMQRALPDGTKRKGWADAKESANLEVELCNTTDESKRAAIRGEIRKMGIAPTC